MQGRRSDAMWQKSVAYADGSTLQCSLCVHVVLFYCRVLLTTRRLRAQKELYGCPHASLPRRLVDPPRRVPSQASRYRVRSGAQPRHARKVLAQEIRAAAKGKMASGPKELRGVFYLSSSLTANTWIASWSGESGGQGERRRGHRGRETRAGAGGGYAISRQGGHH